MELVLIEAPGKVRTVQDHFPARDVHVVSTRGHLFSLPEWRLGVSSSGIEIVPIDPAWIDHLMDLISRSERIWIAADPDREGEVIAKQLFEMAVGLEAYRIRPRSLDKEGLVEAVEFAEDRPDEDLARAGLTRWVVDRLIGFLLSRRAAKDLGESGISIGRVKTPMLARVMEMQDMSCWTGRFIFALGYEGVVACEAVLRKNGGGPEKPKGWFRVKSVRAARRRPTAPLTTARFLARSALAKDVSGAFAAYRTAQSLYERGFLSYIRTREEAVTPPGIAVAERLLEKEGRGRSIVIEPSLPVDAHESIRPAQALLPDEASGLNRDQRAVYEYVCREFMDAAAGREVVTAYAELEHEGAEYHAELRGLHPDLLETLYPGAAAYGAAQPAPSNVRLHDLFLWADENRIGTPGTYVSSVAGLIDGGYLTPAMRVTERGKKVLEWVAENAPWLTPETSSRLETLLDEVRRGVIGYREVFAALQEHGDEEIPLVEEDPAEALERTVRRYVPAERRRRIAGGMSR